MTLTLWIEYIATAPAHIGSLSNIEMTCDVDIIYDGRTITIPVIVDSGCQENLILELVDIQTLNLISLSTREAVMPDHSRATVEVYPDVMIRIGLMDGSYVEASVTPTYLAPVITEEVGVICLERLLGYPALEKLNLKLDFKGKMLTRRIRRI